MQNTKKFVRMYKSETYYWKEEMKGKKFECAMDVSHGFFGKLTFL